MPTLHEERPDGEDTQQFEVDVAPVRRAGYGGNADWNIDAEVWYSRLLTVIAYPLDQAVFSKRIDNAKGLAKASLWERSAFTADISERERKMSARRSIEVEGFSHGVQPIPAASRVGPLIMTGGVAGLDPKTGKLPDDVGEQARLMFWNLERIMVAAGAGLDRVVRMTVYVKVPEARAAVNEQWLRAFPDPASRPARHTLVNETLPSNMLVQCDATAFAAE